MLSKILEVIIQKIFLQVINNIVYFSNMWYDRCHSTNDIDSLISAELPNKFSDPLGYESLM